MATPGGELRCEAVSNEFLDGEDRLDEEGELRLIGLGWASPNPNFKQLWDEPIPFAEVGERMARTLTDVYGVDDLDDVIFMYGRRVVPRT
jgi:hypothetical protein